MPVILIADDHPLFRAALRQAAAAASSDCTILEAERLDTVRERLQADAPVDLVLLDLHMPGNHGLAGLAGLRAEHPEVAIAVCSGHDDLRVVQRTLALGASGFIPKRTDLDGIRAAIQAILDCEIWLPDDLRAALDGRQPDPEDHQLAERIGRLSAQQFRVLTMVAEGLLNKQIAHQLGVRERTVKAHVTAILEKLEVRNRTQASMVLRELEIAEPSVLDMDQPPG